MTSLQLYRTLVPSHAAVSDDTVTTFLGLSAQAHNAAAWGAVYAQAMVWHAAHQLERSPGLVSGGGGAGDVGMITSQRDGDLSRTYAAPVSSGSASAIDAEFGLTRYGQRYLQLRASRAATSPTVVGAGVGVWPGTVLG